jgi:hypothetical protein
MSISRFFLYYLLDVWVNEHVSGSWGTGVGLQCCELCVIVVGMVRAHNVASLSRVISIFQCCSDYSNCPAKIVSSIRGLWS